MNNIYAAIDLGSNSVKLKIIQYIDLHIEVLEDVSKSISVGEDVYETGYIEHSTVKELLDILSSFKAMMDSYHIHSYRAVATGAMREAQNGRNVVELIRMKTGIDVEIIEDTIEKFLTYKSMRDNIENYQTIRKSLLIVELNAGGCDISIYRQNKLIKNDEIKIGTKVLKYILMDLESRNEHYPKVMEEFIETRTSHIWRSIQAKKFENYLAIGGDLRLIRYHLFNRAQTIHRNDFETLYHRVINDYRRLRNEIEAIGIDWYEFVPSILVYHTFLKLVTAQQVMIPDITLRDGIIAEILEKEYKITRYRTFNQDIISQARQISIRYKSSNAHLKNIETNALKIFKQLKNHCLFQQRDELILRLSSILHEIGKYTRMKDYLVTSFDKISNLNILGVTHEETLMVAYTCLFCSSYEVKKYDSFLKGLSEEKYSIVYKLSAILSIADALDKSKHQKISIENVKITDDNLLIFIRCSDDITLEEWSFDNAKHNFINTFGIVPLLIEV